MSMLGSGSYGKVYKEYDKKTNQEYAVKKFKIKRHRDGILRCTLRECDAYMHFSKSIPYMMPCHKIEMDHDSNHIKLYMDVGEETAYDFTRRTENFEDRYSIVPRVLYCLLNFVNSLHYNFFIHRDIKPDNIMIMKNQDIRIIDLGLSKYTGMQQFISNPSRHMEPYIEHTPRCGCQLYTPDDILSRSYTSKLDMYLIGATIVHILHRKKPPLSSHSKYKLNKCKYSDEMFDILKPTEWQSILEKKYKSRIDPDLYDLVYQLLNPSKDLRPNAKAALQHRFFTKQGFSPKPLYIWNGNPMPSLDDYTKYSIITMNNRNSSIYTALKYIDKFPLHIMCFAIYLFDCALMTQRNKHRQTIKNFLDLNIFEPYHILIVCFWILFKLLTTYNWDIYSLSEHIKKSVKDIIILEQHIVSSVHFQLLQRPLSSDLLMFLNKPFTTDMFIQQMRLTNPTSLNNSSTQST